MQLGFVQILPEDEATARHTSRDHMYRDHVIIAPRHLEQLQVYAAAQGLQIRGVQADARELPFEDDSFDVVIMTQALQAVHYPDRVIDDMLRVGKECIITFPNFGYWRCRVYLMTKGRMPVSKLLPYTWYNTPNIHLCTFKDFEALCAEHNIKVLNRIMVGNDNSESWLADRWPNLFGVTAIYHISK